jgi:DNA-binding MarR family transcriptional regulator
MTKKPPLTAQTATLLGIVTQLYSTRMTALLEPKGFTLSQFALLNHLVRSPKETHSINELTEAMEINQPGVSKIVQKLSDIGLLDVSTSPQDSRRRNVSITQSGRETVIEVGQSILPDVNAWFQEWESKDLEMFLGYLGKLAGWLDQHRKENKESLS